MKLSEAESKEKQSVWDPMPELIITSTPESTPTQPYARVDLNPMPESTLYPRQAETLDLASADLSIIRDIQGSRQKEATKRRLYQCRHCHYQCVEPPRVFELERELVNFL